MPVSDVALFDAARKQPALFDAYGYPDRSAVSALAKNLESDETDVYYGLKWLKAKGRFGDQTAKGFYNLVDLLKRKAGTSERLVPIDVTSQGLVVVNADDLLDEEIPQREVLLQGPNDGLLFRQSISQIFAWRGTGKTMIALGIVKALATGSEFLKWKADVPHRVLYIEGELPKKQLQERISNVVGKTNGFLRLVTLDNQPKGIVRLNTAEGQALVERAIVEQGTEVLILDSVSTLTAIATNDEESWMPFLEWLIRLRSRGLCIIFVHHSGKSGMQRGHSRSEDPLDISIKLTSPKDYKPSDGLRCSLSFDKVRERCRDAEPLEISLISDPSGKTTFACTRSEDAVRRQALELLAGGMSEREVAKETGLPKTTIHRWKGQTETPPKVKAIPDSELPF